MAVNEELPAGAGQDAINELQGIRQSIDNIDAALIHLLAERFKFTQSVGRLKAEHGLPPADPAREFLQIQRLRGLAEDARLDPAFAEKFLNFIIAEVIHHHEKIAGDSSSGLRSAGNTVAGAVSGDAAVSTPAGDAPTDAPDASAPGDGQASAGPAA
nr:chorismate mutase [Cryobacterium soli]